MPPVDIAEDNDANIPEQAAAGAMVVADEVGKALSNVVNTHTTITAALVRARELHAQYKDVAFDCETAEGIEAARKAREALREEGRYVIQRLKDTGSKMLGTMQRQFNAACEEHIAEVLSYEKPIHEQIKAVEDRKEREREEKRQREEVRRQRHANNIAAIASLASKAAGMTSQELEDHIEVVRGIVVDESYEEFMAQAAQAKDKALVDLNGMLIAARLDEQERAEMEAERKRMAEVRAAQEARERELAEREQALAKAQAEQAAEAQRLAEEAAAQARAIEARRQSIVARIEGMCRAYGPESYTAATESIAIESAIATLNDTLILPGDFDDKVPEAEKAKEGLLEFLRVTLKLSLEREDEEARMEKERAAREVERQRVERDRKRQELIECYLKWAELAQVATDDGSATSKDLTGVIRSAREVEPTLELFGEEMLEQAKTAFSAAITALNGALNVVEAREEAAAIAAQEMARAQAAAQALKAAKQAHAEELYDELRKVAVMSPDFADGLMADDINDARSLLLRINPNENF